MDGGTHIQRTVSPSHDVTHRAPKGFWKICFHFHFYNGQWDLCIHSNSSDIPLDVRFQVGENVVSWCRQGRSGRHHRARLECCLGYHNHMVSICPSTLLVLPSCLVTSLYLYITVSSPTCAHSLQFYFHTYFYPFYPHPNLVIAHRYLDDLHQS